MRNLAARDAANRRRLHCRHSSRLTIERHELDFKGLAVGVDVNYRSDVTDLQVLVGHRCGEHDPIVFSNHAEGLLIARIRRHEPRGIPARIDNPHRTDQPPPALFNVPQQPPLDNKLLPVHRLGRCHDLAISCDRSEGGHQQLRIVDREAKRLEEPRLTAVVRMGGIQQVVNDLVSLDDGEMGVCPRLLQDQRR
jgi:hypothetical protein